ncbi:uncharacterized protein ARMOST_11510 [Armillaria ostoyae]|uniref:Uncharacterized protein n=1 Tax=Armillaria ostoyae TaxID=47428 RepID=A0A284RHE3_ARMOS|nr:uncharacterized protein ARMOST_11510 [Armillaria ostoyae]
MSRAFPTVVHLAVDFVEINGFGPMTAVTFLSFIFDLNHDNPANASSTGERVPAPSNPGIMVGDLQSNIQDLTKRSSTLHVQ